MYDVDILTQLHRNALILLLQIDVSPQRVIGTPSRTRPPDNSKIFEFFKKCSVFYAKCTVRKLSLRRARDFARIFPKKKCVSGNET